MRPGGTGLAATLLAGALVAACGAEGVAPVVPGAVLLTIDPAPDAPAPEELRVSVFDDTGPLFRNERLPKEGALRAKSKKRLGTIAIHLGATEGAVRLHVRGLAASSQVGEAVLRLDPRRGDRRFTISLSAAPLADRDGDGVPDGIDDCPLPNAAQASCPNPDGGLPPDAAAPVDGAPTPDLAPDQSVDTRGAAPDQRGPAPDLRGAEPDLRAPPPDLRGPEPDLRAPDPDLRAPEPDTRAPEPDTMAPPVKHPNGTACSAATECTSGFCKDGVCCNSACTAQCQSCSTGTCTTVMRAPDPPECPAPRSCNTQAKCRDESM